MLEEYIADDISVLQGALKKYINIKFVGDGAILHKDLLRISDFSYENKIHAKNICMCAYKKYKNNKIDSADTIVPLYLRKSQAERMKNKNG